MRTKIVQTLEQLKGRLIWRVLTGPPSGSTLSMEIGGRRPLTIPLTNPHLSKEDQHNEGEYGLFIECAWRLRLGTEIVCSSRSLDDEIVKVGPHLENQVVASVEIDPASLDFTLFTSDGNTAFSVFCDETDTEESVGNFSIALQDHILVVGAKSIVRVDPRQPPRRPVLRRV